MSSSGTAQTTARNRSGRCVIIAPISKRHWNAFDGQVIAVGVFLRDQVFAGGDEVVEDILLFFEHAGAMPVFAKLSSAAQVGNGVDATVLHPEKHAAAETRRQRDVKAAVARQ